MMTKKHTIHTAFTIGDKVKAKRGCWPHGDHVWTIHKVTLDKDNDIMYEISRPNGSATTTEDDLELYEDPKKQVTMINAQKARELTQIGHANSINHFIRLIENRITQETNNGKYTCSYIIDNEYSHLLDKVLTELRTAGYSVSTYPAEEKDFGDTINNGTCLVIKW